MPAGRARTVARGRGARRRPWTSPRPKLMGRSAAGAHLAGGLGAAEHQAGASYSSREQRRPPAYALARCWWKPSGRPPRIDELIDGLGELAPHCRARRGAMELLARLIRLAPHRDFSVLRRTDESSPLALTITLHVNGLLDRNADLVDGGRASDRVRWASSSRPTSPHVMPPHSNGLQRPATELAARCDPLVPSRPRRPRNKDGEMTKTVTITRISKKRVRPRLEADRVGAWRPGGEQRHMTRRR